MRFPNILRAVFGKHFRKMKLLAILIQRVARPLDKTIRKVLIKKTHFAFSAIPSMKQLATNARGEIERRQGFPFFPKYFSEFFRKSIDGAKRECSLEHLSPKKGAVL